MGHHVCPVCLQGFVLFIGFLAYHGVTDDDIAQQGGDGFSRQAFRHLEGKGQHIGGFVLAAIVAIERLAFGLVDQADGDISRRTPGSLGGMPGPGA